LGDQCDASPNVVIGRVVFEVSDWVIVLNQGRLLTQGRPAEIRVNQEVRSVYFGSRVD
jgi:ABC-type branched-subunit amino acid transport system ATPase component